MLKSAWLSDASGFLQTLYPSAHILLMQIPDFWGLNATRLDDATTLVLREIFHHVHIGAFGVHAYRRPLAEEHQVFVATGSLVTGFLEASVFTFHH